MADEPTKSQVLAVLRFAAGAVEVAIDRTGRKMSRQDLADMKKAWGDLHALLDSTWFQSHDEIRADAAIQLQRKEDVIIECRRQLDAALKRAERLQAEAKNAVTSLVPVFGHPGPNDTPEGTIIDAAWKIRNGYDAGGSNVREGIATLLTNVAQVLKPWITSSYEGHQPSTSLGQSVQLDRIRALIGNPDFRASGGLVKVESLREALYEY